MRRIGTLNDGSLAQRFCDYLITLSIDATSEHEADGPESAWYIWIRDEKDVDRARAEFEQFCESPEDSRYQVNEQATRIREERIAEHQQRVKQHRETIRSMPTGSSGGSLGPMLAAPVKQQGIPVTIAIIAISIVVSFISNFSLQYSNRSSTELTLDKKVYYGLSFVDFREWVKSEDDDFASIRKGEVWRIITPMFLHGGMVHLLFNMIMLYHFGSVIERLHGSLFFALLVFGCQIAGMMLQVSLPNEGIPTPFLGTPFAVGASGAVYGLFGYLWIRPYVDPSYPIRLVPANIAVMLGFLVLCMTPVIPNIANGGHLGGLFAGMLAAMATQVLRR